MASMQEMRKHILQLTGKYDTLVQNVKDLKTKIKKDEATIKGLQKEVNQLKQQKGGNNNYNAGNNKINKMQKVTSAPAQSQPKPNNNANMDPVDMFFSGGGNGGNNTTSNGGGAQQQNNGNTQTNGGGGGGDDAFASWTSFN